MRLVRSAMVAAIAILVDACAPTVHMVPLMDEKRAPSAASAPVRFYVGSQPRCSVEEIALLKVVDAQELWSDATARAIRKRARAMGGDAVTGLREVVESAGATVTHARHQERWQDSSGTKQVLRTTTSDTTAAQPSIKRYLLGTVVRFAQDDCRQ